MPRRKKTHKIVSLVIFLVLFVTAGIIGYLVYDSYFANKSKQSSHDSSQKIEQIENTTPAKTEDPSENNTAPAEDNKTPAKYDSEDPNKSDTLTGAVTYAGKNGDKLSIRVNIDQYLSSGNCNLVISQNGAEVYKSSVSLIDGASTSTCEGFDVPATNFSGKYLITINLVTDSKTGKITKEVNL